MMFDPHRACPGERGSGPGALQNYLAHPCCREARWVLCLHRLTNQKLLKMRRIFFGTDEVNTRGMASKMGPCGARTARLSAFL